MNKSVMIVELREIYEEAINQGYEVSYLSKGPEWDRESLNYADAKEFAKFDIVILEGSQQKAEELRKKMEPYKQKDTIICWCLWNSFWCNNGGKYQVSKIDKSFIGGDIFEAVNPSFAGFRAAYDELKVLNGNALQK